MYGRWVGGASRTRAFFVCACAFHACDDWCSDAHVVDGVYARAKARLGVGVRVKARAFVFGEVETGQSFYEEVVQQYYHEIDCT